MSDVTSKIAINLADVEIRPLDRSVDRAAFCCGIEKIDNFCRQNARAHHESDRARVYLATYDGKLAGFYYLVVSSAEAALISNEADKKFSRVQRAPLVYLGMIGVDQSFKRCGIGKLLMVDAMRTTLMIADLAGVYALHLDARDNTVAPFYESLGFSYFKEGELKMYIPVREIREALKDIL